MYAYFETGIIQALYFMYLVQYMCYHFVEGMSELLFPDWKKDVWGVDTAKKQ